MDNKTSASNFKKHTSVLCAVGDFSIPKPGLAQWTHDDRIIVQKVDQETGKPIEMVLDISVDQVSVWKSMSEKYRDWWTIIIFVKEKKYRMTFFQKADDGSFIDFRWWTDALKKANVKYKALALSRTEIYVFLIIAGIVVVPVIFIFAVHLLGRIFLR